MKWIKYLLIYIVLSYVAMISLRLTNYVLNWDIVWFAPVSFPTLIILLILILICRILGL